MNFEEIEQGISEAIKPLITFQEHCEQVERDLPGDFYSRAIANIRALQKALRPLNDELKQIGMLITVSENLYKAKIKISYSIEHLNEIVIQVVVLQQMRPFSVEALRKRRYIAGLIKELLIEDIQATLVSIKMSVTPTAAASYRRGNLSLVIVSEEKK